jgi:gluconolactonase
MKLNTVFAILWSLMGSSLTFAALSAPQDETLPRKVTVTGIAGVISGGTEWQQAWQGTDNADGLLGLPDGSLLFAQEQTSTIRKLDERDFDSAYVKDTHGAGSVSMDAQGRLIAAQRTCTDPGRGDLPCTEPGMISIIYPENQRKLLADDHQGEGLGRPNDLVVAGNGAVYFTSGAPYQIKPNGQVISLGDDIGSNGIMLSPDEMTLYVTNRSVIVAFNIGPDGTVGDRRDFVSLPSGNGDGMVVDSTGRLYVASQASGVHVFSPEGQHLGTIPTPRNVASLAFSGPGKRTLYATGRGGLAPNGKELLLADGYRNNTKSIYKIQMLSQGYMGRPK